MFSATLVIPAQICDELLGGQGKAHGRMDRWTDGQTQAMTIVTIPLRPERSRGKNLTRWVDGTPTTGPNGMVMNDLLPPPLCNVNRPSHSEIQLFQNLTMAWKSMIKVMCVVKGRGHVWPSKFKGQSYCQGQTHWSHLGPGVQSICLLFVSWQSDHFWLRYRKFHIWPWKFKVKVMAKVKPDGHIWGLGVQSICLLFVLWQSDHFGWDIANSIFDLENSRSRSWPRSNLMITFEP